MSLRRTYRKIAKKHGVTVEEVKKEMQAAIDYAYQNPDKNQCEKVIQSRIAAKGEIPTPKDVITYTAGVLKYDPK